MERDRLLGEMAARLEAQLGDRLVTVALYGPAAHGDDDLAPGHLHLLIVLADLDIGGLDELVDPIHWWLRRGQPWPRLFTRQLLRDALDVYPIELLDIARHHRLLRGAPLDIDAAAIDAGHLRLQCERELREKLMRMREGYIACRGKKRPLLRLLRESYASLTPIMRGCLHLLDGPPPASDHDVVKSLCERLDLPAGAFEEAARVADGAHTGDPRAILDDFHRAASALTTRIDRLWSEEGANR